MIEKVGPTIHKPGACKSPGIYKGASGVYNGRGVYNDGKGGGGIEYIDVTIEGILYKAVKLGNLAITPGLRHRPGNYDIDYVGPNYNVLNITKYGALYAYGELSRLQNLPLPNGFRIITHNDVLYIKENFGNDLSLLLCNEPGLWYNVGINPYGIYPAGGYNINSQVSGFNESLQAWTSTQYSSDRSYKFSIWGTSIYENENAQNNTNFYSIICVKDV